MVTIKDIAYACGVSEGTVDRALNNRTGINAKTKMKILNAAAEMNYRPDYTARSLARGRSMTIGVVLFNLHNRSFAQLMDAIESRARKLGYFVDLMLTEKDPDQERKSIDYLVSRKADGIILFSVNKGDEFDQYLKSLNKPIVTVCNRISDHWSYVGIDDRQAMKDAVSYILDKGYQRIIYVCPPLAKRGKTNIYTQEERLQGCMEALHNVDEQLAVVQDKDFVSVLKKVDFSAIPKTAILCSCDHYALEVINFANGHGLEIPNDIGLMGFDNIDVLKYITPKLTTVEYAMELIGLRATELLISEIETRERSSIPLLSHKIVPGNSL